MRAGLVHAIKPGDAKIRAAGDGATGETSVRVVKNSAASLQISPATSSAKRGDVVHFAAKDKKGGSIAAEISWSVQIPARRFAGWFVCRGAARHIHHSGALGDRAAFASVVVAPRNVARETEVIGHVMPKTNSLPRNGSGITTLISRPSATRSTCTTSRIPRNPQTADPLKVDARIVNDVSVTPDGKIGVVTREGASSRKKRHRFSRHYRRDASHKFFRNTRLRSPGACIALILILIMVSH